MPIDPRRRTDSGQVLPLVCVVILLAGACAMLLAELGGRAVALAQAQTAADAAALAGAADGREAAAEVARANGAVLVSFAADGADDEVVVRVGSAVASARARRSGGAAPLPAERAPPGR